MKGPNKTKTTERLMGRTANPTEKEKLFGDHLEHLLSKQVQQTCF